MTTSDATQPVLQSRCYVNDMLFEIEVAVHESNHRSTYHAVAFAAGHDVAPRRPVVNDRGMPLVAIARSPEKAASFMSSALRRKLQRAEVRPLGAAERQTFSVAVAAGSE
jgi:hypothetical protein